MTELSDDEKELLVKLAMSILMPVAERYELDTQTGRMALYEAFQLGIKFAHGEGQRIKEEMEND